MLGNLSGWHLVVIVFVVLLLFGAPKLPGLARSLGQSMKIFKKEVTETDTSSADADANTAESVADGAESAPKKTAAKTSAKKKSDADSA
jgi:sec-independent protein translocase protein TatA